MKLLIRHGEALTPFGLNLPKPIHLSTSSRRIDFKHNLTGSIASRIIICLLLACLLIPHANAARLGRIFFTPQQRLDLEHSNARNTSAAGNDQSALTVNGIVQKHGGSRTVWINGVPQKAGKSDEHNPEALSVDLPGKSKRVKIKVGQKLQLDQPVSPNSPTPDD